MVILPQGETDTEQAIIEEIGNMWQEFTVEELKIILEAMYIMREKIEYSSYEELYEMAKKRYENKEVA